MTCKDCIHSGLCYKENDYDNFPDRCGRFISYKVIEANAPTVERPTGKWELKGFFYKCSNCGHNIDGQDSDNYCCKCGAKMVSENDKHNSV